MMLNSNPILVGTAGGTFLSVLPNLRSEDILKTIVLAALGAVVSFLLSLLFRYLSKKYKK